MYYGICINHPDIQLHINMWWLIDLLGQVQLCYHMFYNIVYAQSTIIKNLLTYLITYLLIWAK